jgi:2Fe-2S ferredoxin
MRAAVDHGVPKIIGECGGELACATCHVFVDPEWFDRLAAANDDELAMLQVTSEEPTQYSRLSCQIAVVEDLDGLIVNVPETQR